MKRSKKMFTVMLALCVALSMAMASVTANAATKKPKKIYLKATSTTVDIKGKVKVSVYKTKPSKASKSVKWKSSNKKVATVSKSGYVTGKKKGTVKITATSKKNKRAKKTIKIKVTNLKAKSVTMSKKSAILFPNDKTTLKATVKGSAGFYNQGVTWKSSNTSVATVTSKGIVTAKKAGKATITATEKGGSKKATCAVTVSGIKVDKANKSVSVTATVNNADAKSMHYVVYKNGGAAKTSYFVTDATPAELNAALGKISAKAWDTQSKIDTKKDKVAQAGNKTIDELAQSGVGNKNYTKFDITIKNGDQTIKMIDTLKGAQDNDNFSMIYSNVANNHNAGSGCLTCNTSCYAGVVTNEFKTWAEPFVPQNMPAKGTTVTITYTAQTDNYISAKTLKDNADNYVIVDARKAADFAEGHIDGAVSADMDGFVGKSITEAQSKANVKAVVDKYGKNKKYAVICYSGNRYAQAASAELRSLGVSNDNIFTLGGDKARKSANGGMKAWKAAGYEVVVAYNYTDVAGVKAAQSDTVILDARKADDYKDAHIGGAVSADMDGYVSGTISKADSDNNIKSVVEQKGADKKYIIICYSGNRYAKAATEVLVKNGVKVSNIAILTGGMGAWRSAGEALDHYNYTNADTTFSKMKDSSYVILDARKAADYEKGHIAGAVSADVGYYIDNKYSSKDAAAANVKAAVDKYGKDKNYIVICYSGNRYAKVATGLLMNNGIKNANIQTLGGDDSQQSKTGGMQAWNAKYAGYVVAKHTSSKGFNFANGITPENLKADVDGQKVFTVMDVRAKDDFDKGHISNAVSTPSGDEAAVMKAVNDNKNGLYVLVCYSGNAKANEARNTMVKNGVDESRIICLQGGMGTWK
ncbi:MAG: rhodanese-like domain-containing protein [Clostridia bacterium]